MQVSGWYLKAQGEPLVRDVREERAGPGEVIVQVAGCGVCHTDLGFVYDGVPTRHPLPLVLGHEISGTVVEAGEGAETWVDEDVVVPAVMPCGACRACRIGRGPICRHQIFPGNDVHGGFASHVRVPARGLCPVPQDGRGDLALADLSVIADAVSTPYQAIRRAELAEGDLAVFIGVGGVGGFGVQIAAALGATIVAVDIDADRLDRMSDHGAERTLDSSELSFKELRTAVRELAAEREIPSWRWKVFETSGAPAGQSTAFGLLGHGSYLSVVGYTPRKVEVRLSNLMALDATAQGNWGCLPELYPEVLDLVLEGRVALEPFLERRPLETINDTLAAVHDGQVERRVVLVPEEA